MDCSATTKEHEYKVSEDQESRTENHGSFTSKELNSRILIEHERRTDKDHESRTMKDHDSKHVKDYETRTTKDHVPASISFEKSSSSYGMRNRKNKTRLISEDEMPEVQDSEAIEEDPMEDIGDISVEKNGGRSEKDGGQGSPSGSVVLVGDARLVFLVTFVSYFLVRKRKGTLL